MKKYLNVLQKILDDGIEKESGRANMPNTIGISKADIEINLQNGFPLLTTKKMYWKGIVHELLWFLKGDTNIKYLVDNNVNIWNGDAYRWYIKHAEGNDTSLNPIMYDNGDGTLRMLCEDEFVQFIKNNDILPSITDGSYKLGDLGKVYGYQWRNQNGVDQIQEVLNGLKNNPYSRYHIIDGWNKANFKEMALPPCHLLYQFIVRPLNSYQREDLFADKHNFTYDQRLEMNPNDSDEHVHQLMDEDNIPKYYLDLNMYQRSCDTFLGVPFNIASMSLLLTIFAKTNNMVAGFANWIGGDTHLYIDHIPMVKEQLIRKPYTLPELKIKKEINSLDDICSLTINDFELINYKYHDKIKAELFVGLKK